MVTAQPHNSQFCYMYILKENIILLNSLKCNNLNIVVIYIE